MTSIGQLQPAVATDSPALSPFPINNLPLEIMIAILHEVGQSAQQPHQLGLLPFPITVSHVCRMWRNIVLDAATLWSDIRLHSDRTSGKPEVFHTYMHRSKSCLVNVTCYSHSITSTSAIDILDAVVQDLVPHMGRVRKLTIMVEEDSVLRRLLGVLGGVVARSLESIRISVLDPLGHLLDEDVFRPLPPLFSGGAQLLRSVHLDGVLGFNQQNFKQLTSLSLVMTDVYNIIDLRLVLELLRDTSGTLSRLKISRLTFGTGAPAADHLPVNLPVLESMHLQDVTLSHFLRTPCLKSLVLHFFEDEAFSSFVMRCSAFEYSTLRSLKLEGVNLEIVTEPVSFLRGLPLLESLKLVECDGEQKLLKQLGKRAAREGPASTMSDPQNQQESEVAGECLLGKLRALCFTREWSWPEVFALIIDRIKMGYPIPCINCLEPATYITPDNLNALGRLGIDYWSKIQDDACDSDVEWTKEEWQFQSEADGYPSSDDDLTPEDLEGN